MIALFLGSKIGRWLLAAGAIIVAVLAAVIKIFAAGKQAAQTEGLKEQVKNAGIHDKISDTVAAKPADAVRDELRRDWSKP